MDEKLLCRVGAGRLTGEKCRIVRNIDDNQKYVICNAYDADTRAWAARSRLERNPHQVIEGIVLAAYALGATEAYLFTRNMYLEAVASVQKARYEALEAHLVGRDVLGSELSCTINAIGADIGFMSGG